MQSLYTRQEFSLFKKFQLFGYLLGGMVPILLFIIFELAGLNQNILQKDCATMILIFFVVGLALGIIALLCDGYYHESHPLITHTFSIQSYFSIIVIHLLVLYTGGPKESVFTASYLYLPAIVGYVYGAGKKLYLAVGALILSYLLNIFLPETQQKITDTFMVWHASFINYTVSAEKSSNSKWIYTIIFLIQIFMTTYIARQQSRIKKIDATKESI